MGHPKLGHPKLGHPKLGHCKMGHPKKDAPTNKKHQNQASPEIDFGSVFAYNRKWGTKI